MSEPDTSKKSRLRQLAEEKNDFGDHGHDSQAGVPAEAAHGQGAGGKYKALPPQVGGGRGPVNIPAPFKNVRGGK
jgi:hypothetical protein